MTTITVKEAAWRRNGFMKSRDDIPRDTDGEPLLDAPIAAKALETSVNTLKQWHRRGKIAAARRGPHNCWMYRRDEVQRVAKILAKKRRTI